MEEIPINITSMIQHPHNLNKTFKMKELKLAIKKMKSKKSPGYDGIPIEIIKLAPERILQFILKLLNLRLKDHIAPYDWCISLISPFHKDGQEQNPDNYRGICLMNNLLKVHMHYLERYLEHANIY